MWVFSGITVALFLGLAFFTAYMKREEIMANWSKYRTDPLYMFAAPLFKPAEDPRSPVQFAADNFKDNIMAMITKIFGVFLQPIFKIFGIFIDSLNQTSSGLFNIKAFLANMRDKWNKITDPFMRRFYTIFHRFRVTFIHLFTSMQRTLGVAVSSIYSGLSVITTMLSFLDLIVNVIIVILFTLIILMILPPFILLPFLPLILICIFMISQTASAAGVGGLAGTFCFQKGTQIEMLEATKSIEQIEIGETLKTGGTVLGVMKFSEKADDLFSIHGVVVSGTHIIYQEGKPCHVKDHPDAIPYTNEVTELYCLITSDRKIPVQSTTGSLLFADWEEFSEEEEQQRWNLEVFRILNPDLHPVYKQDCTEENLQSEAVFSEDTRIGEKPIQDIRPGDLVPDTDGSYTQVTGIVQIHESEVLTSHPIGKDVYMSSAVWSLGKNGVWEQTKGKLSAPRLKKWYSLFTKSGTFQIHTDEGEKLVRDFTDVGSDRISDTYDWVLASLLKKK